MKGGRKGWRVWIRGREKDIFGKGVFFGKKKLVFSNLEGCADGELECAFIRTNQDEDPRTKVNFFMKRSGPKSPSN